VLEGEGFRGAAIGETFARHRHASVGKALIGQPPA
jgi:hypothetical protein